MQALELGDTPTTISQMLADRTRESPEQIASIDELGAISFSDLHGWATLLANELRDRISPGDRIAIWSENSSRWVALALAAARLRATIVPLNTRYRATELKHALTLTGVKHMFLDRKVRSNDLCATFSRACLRADLSIDSTTYPHLESFTDISGWRCPDNAKTSPQETDALPDPSPDDAFVVFFSSGSTGLPKAIAHTQRSIAAHARYTAVRQRLTNDDRGLVAPPLCGSFGFITLFEFLSAGIPSALTSESSPEPLGAFISRHKCTVANITDAYFNPIIFGGDPSVLNTIRKCAGGVFEVDPGEFVARMDEVGIPFTHAYGISENQALGFLTSDTAPAELRARPGGRAVTPGTQARVVDPVTKQVLEPGERGTLQIQSPVSMKGYLHVDNGRVRYDSPLDTDSWFDTGDFAHVDENGDVEYLGRLKDVFRLHGFLVSPTEIESALSSLPEVQICKVVGVESGPRTQVVAFVESETDTPRDFADTIIKQARNVVAGYKLPDVFVVIPRLPHIDASTGVKVDIRRLRQMAEDCLNRDDHDLVARAVTSRPVK